MEEAPKAGAKKFLPWVYIPCFHRRWFMIPATTSGLEWGVLQCRCVEGLKWYIYHGRPSLAMIGDLFVLPELCAHSLSTFYSRFHCRPLNHFGLSVSHQTRNLWLLSARNTSKDEMNCSIKVWPLVWHAQWQNLQHFDFRPSSTKQCSKSTVRPKRFFFTWESTVRHKPLPRLTQNKCYTVYTRNLIHAFTSVF